MEELLKRLKSFAWRLLGMSSVALMAFVSNNLDLLDFTNISPEIKGLIVMVIGLVVGEITKFLNNKFELEDKALGAIRRLRGR